MKKLAMILALMLLAATAALSLAGCGGHDDKNTDKVDSTRSQIYAGIMDGGWGDAFLVSAKGKFEEKYKDVSFEDGKTGVQVMIDKQRTYNGVILRESMKTTFNEIFFTENINYYDFINAGVLADITDVVTAPLTEFGETKSIEDKMYPEEKEFLKRKSDNKYYAVPFVEPYSGIIYDADLFDSYGFYLGKGGGYVNAAGEKSAGPDGQTGTWDDGFPATYDEFFDLVDYIDGSSVVPIIWSGQYPEYASYVGTSLWTDYEGPANTRLNFTFGGTADNLVSADAAGNLTPLGPTEIGESNAALLGKQAGRFYGLDFLRRLVLSGGYHNLSYSPTLSHTNTQQEFLYSAHMSGKKPIAMMCECTWWEGEATPVFEEMAVNDASLGKKARNLGFMPLPKATTAQIGSNGGKQTLMQLNENAIFVNSRTAPAKLPLVKKFLQFFLTDAMMVNFTQVTGNPLGYNYTLTEADQAAMSPFGRSVWATKMNSTIIYTGADSALYLNHQGDVLNTRLMWDAVIGSTSYRFPVTYYKNNSTQPTKAYFDGVGKYYANIFGEPK
ncbi:hypothetical protein FACS1894211_08660 [Clostridia bacterium]|nr:hypothetical protein FACS1894211_08660 [Clostridia bacterium]